MFTKQEWDGQKFLFPNTLREWNTLPDYILEEQFTEIVPCHQTIDNFM